MKHTRLGGIVALSTMSVVGSLALSACGSNSNSPSAATSAASSAAATGSSAAATGSSAAATGSSAAATGSSAAATGSSAAATGSSTAAGGTGIVCAKGTLTLSGSTAQSNAMSQWITNYQKACPGSTINYGGGGSGKGVADFIAKTTDFAGSDFPLGAADQPNADKRCTGGSAIDLPMVPGPIAIGFNVPGVTTLNLSASVLAKIFSGKITKWDDAAIKADNSGVKLPSLAIQTFHRSDGSGTSFNFTNYLTNEAASDWSYGANKTWPAPGGQGSKGTAGIAQGVKSTPGGVGYMEESFATQNKITIAKVGNAGGKFVELTNDNVVNFLSKASSTGTGNDLKLAFDFKNTDENAYPSLLVTYEIVCSAGNSAAQLPLIKGFLGYIASDAGQGILPDNGYVKLPANIQSKVQASIAAMS